MALFKGSISPKQLLKYTMAIALMIAIVMSYFFDPMTATFSYRCPVKALTGFDCPGCGGQRAIHALLHLRIREAVNYNPFLVIAALYLFAVISLTFLHSPRFDKTRRIVLGERTALAYLLLMLLWAVIRNFPAFHFS